MQIGSAICNILLGTIQPGSPNRTQFIKPRPKGFKDWFLQVFKRPAFTIEAGLGENPLPASQLPEIARALSAIFTAAMQW